MEYKKSSYKGLLRHDQILPHSSSLTGSEENQKSAGKTISADNESDVPTLNPSTNDSFKTIYLKYESLEDNK